MGPRTRQQELSGRWTNFREAVAESERPVLLYSVGKDSAVLRHLAMKAFYPAKPPFPLLHVDTTWKFGDPQAAAARTVAPVQRAQAAGGDVWQYIERENIRS